jgi:hypothetical protein
LTSMTITIYNWLETAETNLFYLQSSRITSITPTRDGGANTEHYANTMQTLANTEQTLLNTSKH